jgi:predicted phage-related endonuclease
VTVRYHTDVEQGSDEWAKLRTGLLTASEMKLVITPTLKIADNDKTRAHLWELLAQRITNYVEPTFYGDDMMRGHEDEVEARRLYRANHSPTHSCGFITNDRWGFTIGCSPDDLVGDDGMIECKSRRQKYQIQTIADDEVPAEYMMQIQTSMLVAERSWLDFISYSGGLPMFVKRVEADPDTQAAIVAAATSFEERLADKLREYHATLAAMPKLIPTERRIELEMYV